MPRVFDTFPVYNEFEMVELRLKTLGDVVDYTLSVASWVTHAGKPNPHALHWNNQAEYPVVVALETDYGTSIAATRRREMRQRNNIVRYLDTMYEMKPDDIVLVSDADEIPNPGLVQHLREHGIDEGMVIVFRQRMCYYDLNTTQGYIWQGTRAVRWDDLCALSAHVVRYGLGAHDQHYPKYVVAQPGGWHLSYFGGAAKVQEKMMNFLHQELVTDENTQQDTIAERIAAGADIWGRDEHGWTIERTLDVPPPVLADPQRWAHLWRPGYEPEEA